MPHDCLRSHDLRGLSGVYVYVYVCVHAQTHCILMYMYTHTHSHTPHTHTHTHRFWHARDDNARGRLHGVYNFISFPRRPREPRPGQRPPRFMASVARPRPQHVFLLLTRGASCVAPNTPTPLTVPHTVC
jgi:hypothetical protein